MEREEGRLGKQDGIALWLRKLVVKHHPVPTKALQMTIRGILEEGKNRGSDLFDLVFLVSRNQFPQISMCVENVSGREGDGPADLPYKGFGWADE